MSTSTTLPRDVAVCHLPHPFALARGGVLEAPHVAFERSGAVDAPVVAVLGGISAGRHVAADPADPSRGFWDGLVGPAKAIDTGRFGVLSIDWLGGAGASTRAELGFPGIDVRDQARALIHVCDALRIERLHAVVGGSYGGMVALAVAAGHPTRVERVGVIAAAHRSRPSATAWRALQRRIVRLGLATGRADEALSLARALGITSYRGRAELDARFAGGPRADAVGALRFPIEDYLDAHGRRFAQRFTPEALLCLSESIDACDLEPRAVRAPATVVGIRGDELVTPNAVRECAAQLGGPVVHVEIESCFGHDGFLLEIDALTPIVRALLAQEVTA